MTAKKLYAKPDIMLLAADHDRLTALARAVMYQQPEIAAVLNEELERAHVVSDDRHWKHIVRLGSGVVFQDDTTGTTRRVSLVLPGEADISRGKISVLTPIGAALIGLRTRLIDRVANRNGQVKQLTVLEVDEAHDERG